MRLCVGVAVAVVRTVTLTTHQHAHRLETLIDLLPCVRTLLFLLISYDTVNCIYLFGYKFETNVWHQHAFSRSFTRFIYLLSTFAKTVDETV